MTIYVGNLALTARQEQLESLFAAYGPVDKVTVMTDPETGLSRGFGFVEMPDPGAEQAIAALDGVEHLGSLLRVNVARDRGARPPRRSW